MWVARNEDGSLMSFNRKPIRHKNIQYGGCWQDSLSTNPDKVPEFMKIDSGLFPLLKWEHEPIEVMTLPKPTIENVYTNPIYKSIMDLGKEDLIEYSDIVKESDNKIADTLHIFKQSHYCRNNGHPYCFDGSHCNTCKGWHFDILKYISEYVGSKR